MCGSSGCCGNVSNDVRRFGLSNVQALHDRAQRHAAGRLSVKNARISLLSSGTTPALEILSDDPNDKSSILIFQKLGVFGALELKIKKFELTPPKADVVLWFKYDPFDGGLFSVEGTVTIHCDDIANPLGCSVEVDLGPTSAEAQPLINWDCIKRCAPQCLYCGGVWQCWLGCAGGCIIQCL